MLTMKQSVNFTGTSSIDGKAMARYNANINPDDPESLSIATAIVDKDGYRDNREECHKDQDEFENVVYAVQAEMLEQNAKVAKK